MEKKISKSAFAQSLGVSRSSLYYIPKQPAKDAELRERILQTLTEHPAYGHRRIAIDLGTGENRINRVMVKFGLKPRITHRKPIMAIKRRLAAYRTELKVFLPLLPMSSGLVILPLAFHHTMVYLATVIDRYTREVIAWQIGLHHTTQLVLDVLRDALQKRNATPYIFHSDQGSEYPSNACIQWIVDHKIHLSHSPKSKPWKNGHQESFYDNFKSEFGRPSRHLTI